MFVVGPFVVGRWRVEPVHVAIVHTEGRGGKNRIVDDLVIRPMPSGPPDVFLGNRPGVPLHLVSNAEKSLHLLAEVGLLDSVLDDLAHHLGAFSEEMLGGGTVGASAELTLVLSRGVSGN